MHKNRRGRSTTAVRSMSKNKQAAMQTAYKIRQLILRAVSKADAKEGITLNNIKKFLDSKENGLSNRPEFKLVMKKVLETRHLSRVDGKYVFNAKSIRKQNPKDSAVIKVLQEAVERDAVAESVPDAISAPIKRLSRSSTTESKKRVPSERRDTSASAQIEKNADLQGAGDNSSVSAGDAKTEKTKKKRKYKKRSTDGDGNALKNTGGEADDNNRELHGGGDAVTLADIPSVDLAVAPKRKRSRAASSERQ